MVTITVIYYSCNFPSQMTFKTIWKPKHYSKITGTTKKDFGLLPIGTSFRKKCFLLKNMLQYLRKTYSRLEQWAILTIAVQKHTDLQNIFKLLQQHWQFPSFLIIILWYYGFDKLLKQSQKNLKKSMLFFEKKNLMFELLFEHYLIGVVLQFIMIANFLKMSFPYNRYKDKPFWLCKVGLEN